MVMKIRKKKRLSKKVIPSTLFSVEKENIKIMDTKMASLNPKDLENSGKTAQNLSRSVSTVVTQVSQDSQHSGSSVSPENNGLTLPDHSDSNLINRPKRFPSEGN